MLGTLRGRRAGSLWLLCRCPQAAKQFAFRPDQKVWLIVQDFEYDWSTGSFRDPKTGKVWDFDKKALVDDAKTPKPAAKPNGGGQ